ncbi:MAG TPA: RNA polymerase sigma factor [Candidatus Acidoferrales bacterium]|nr:RNA polymerase sigma factor [Candidatus Acidoferrales bacterium]
MATPKAAKKAAVEDARSDRELVYAARDGDMLAFDALFYRYKDGIFRLGFAITKDPSAAEEIVVDTFARAHRALARLEPEGSLRPWLYRVAVNLSYNRRPRKNVILSALEDATEEVVESGERSPSNLAELAELRRVVLAAVDTLGPKHRTVVVLHYLNGLNLAEIALVVDCPVGTVKSRLHYALQRLRAHLAAHPELGFEPRAILSATRGRTPVPVIEPVRSEE